MRSWTTLFVCLISLIVGAFPATAQQPPLPFVTHNACEGEDCWMASEGLGWMVSDTMLHVVRKPLDRSRIAFVIPKGSRFEVLAHDLYTLTTLPIRIAPHDERGDHGCDDPRVKMGDWVYPLYYSGEGYWRTWSQGKTMHCWEPYPSDIKAEQVNHVQIWLQIRYDGREGWWGQPLHCRGPWHESNCPKITRAYPLPSWLRIKWWALYKARAF